MQISPWPPPFPGAPTPPPLAVEGAAARLPLDPGRGPRGCTGLHPRPRASVMRGGAQRRTNGCFSPPFSQIASPQLSSPLRRISFPWGGDGHCLFAGIACQPWPPASHLSEARKRKAGQAWQKGTHPTRRGSSGSVELASRTRAFSSLRSPRETRGATHLWGVPGRRRPTRGHPVFHGLH